MNEPATLPDLIDALNTGRLALPPDSVVRRPYVVRRRLIWPFTNLAMPRPSLKPVPTWDIGDGNTCYVQGRGIGLVIPIVEVGMGGEVIPGLEHETCDRIVEYAFLCTSLKHLRQDNQQELFNSIRPMAVAA